MRAMMLTALLTMMCVAGCAATPSDSAICDGSAASRKALAAALVEDGGPLSQRAGLRLLDQISAACG